MSVHYAEDGCVPVPDMSALIARLEAGEIGCGLDEAISDVLCKRKFRTCIAGLSDEQGGMWMYEFDGHTPSSALRVTQSLDAALALAEWVLELRGPININVCLAGSAQAQIYPDDPCGVHVQAVAQSPAPALCIAILKAKAQGEGG